MATSTMFRVLILGISLALKSEFSVSHGIEETEGRPVTALLLYQIIGDMYELQTENKIMAEKYEMLEEKLESLEATLETSAKGKS